MRTKNNAIGAAPNRKQMAQRLGALALCLALFSNQSVVAGTTTYKYDDLGRLIAVKAPSGQVTSYRYDNANNRTQGNTSANNTSGTIYVTETGQTLRSLADDAGYSGASAGTYNFVVPGNIILTGTAGSAATLTTGTWPAGSTLTLVIDGVVSGGGGGGGTGGNTGNGFAGGNGGDAIYASTPIAITVSSTGAIRAGGGGGGGASGYRPTGSTGVYVGGGGGGGGYPNGPGGPGGISIGSTSIAPDGNPGTMSGGGTAPNHVSKGGDGGNAGIAGAAGQSTTYIGGAAGSSGYAVRKNGNTVTVTVNSGGSVVGPVG